MCQRAPGPRCAPHAKAQMESSQRSLAQAELELETALSQSRLTRARSGGLTITSLDRTAEEQAQIDALIDHATDARKRYEMARLDYFGTPTGKRVLRGEIEVADGGGYRARALELRTIFTKAEMLRAWRKNAMTRAFDPTYYRQSVA